MQLKSTDKIGLITDAAVTVDVVFDFIDMTTADPPVVKGSTSDTQPTAITTATTTDVVAAPAASTVRNVTKGTIRNKHATTSVGVTIQKDRSGTPYELHKTTLLAGEMIFYSESLGFYTHSAGKTAATQAEQEAGASLTTFVAPGTQHYHPSAVKCWGKAGITGNLLGSYNVTSVTDTGTGALTVTIANDFSSTNYSITATIEFTSTTLAQSCTCDTVAAGSFVLRSVVEAGSAADPVTWSWQCCGDQ